jgi:hypothetical protein
MTATACPLWKIRNTTALMKRVAEQEIAFADCYWRFPGEPEARF